MSDFPLLNADTVQRRLRAIRDRVDELGQLGVVTGARLTEDWMLRAAVERELTQLVELAVQINMHVVAAAGKVRPTGYRESFAAAMEVGVLSPVLFHVRSGGRKVAREPALLAGSTGLMWG